MLQGKSIKFSGPQVWVCLFQEQTESAWKLTAEQVLTWFCLDKLFIVALTKKVL